VDPVEDAWKRETSYALYRWVIQQKRAKSVQSYLGAKGVLAYARAFETKFSKPLSDTSSAMTDIPEYLNEPTVASIEVGLEQARNKEENSQLFWRVFFNRTMPVLGFALAIISLVYVQPEGGPTTISHRAMGGLTQLINEHLLWILGGLVVVSIAFNIGIVFRTRLAQSQIALDFLRFIIRVPRRVVLILTLLLILSVLYFLFLAYFQVGIALQPHEMGP
jgi:hypothetical protein